MFQSICNVLVDSQFFADYSKRFSSKEAIIFKNDTSKIF